MFSRINPIPSQRKRLLEKTPIFVVYVSNVD